METKICNRCKIEKEVDNFHKDKYSKDGLTCQCKLCKKEHDKEFYKKKLVSSDEKEKRNQYLKKYREENRQKIIEYRKKMYEIRKEEILSKNKMWIENNCERRKEYTKNYAIKNKNRRKIRDFINSKVDPLFNLKLSIRSRIRQFLKQKGFTKKNKTFNIIGCSPSFLKEYLEKQFDYGMSWDNRNKWHIDHIIPLSSAKTEEEVYKLCHYSNLQPLWAMDNMKKGNKFPF